MSNTFSHDLIILYQELFQFPLNGAFRVCLVLEFCHTWRLSEVTPLDETHSAFGAEPGHNGGLVVFRFTAVLPSLRMSNSQIYRQVLLMLLFSSAFMEMAGRFSCHHTMPKQAGMSNSIKSTRLCQVGSGPM